jgi:hypothetical protein
MPETEFSIAIMPADEWLEQIEGNAPILLIAPHGGRAGAAARATLHPKVNDLETAEITRELAARLGAGALINFGMDRNELDCNRLGQVSRRTPWLLDLIADRVAAIIEQHGRVTVLLIHGWNVIEPRIDFGLGLRERGGRLQPPAGAYISASDAFIRGPVARLAEHLRDAGILPTFGLRYPGGGSQNLLQAFTPRHRTSPLASLMRLAAIARDGQIDALQLEMSVALRLQGDLRRRSLDILGEVFSQSTVVPPTLSHAHDPIRIVRAAPSLGAVKTKAAADTKPPIRVGIEFFDPVSSLGAMASFDFGANSAGGRIMVLFDGCRAALFTAEGKATREGHNLRLGPLELDAPPSHGSLKFRGTAVLVSDGAAYLSVENALAGGRLDPSMELSAELEFFDGGRQGLLAEHLAHVLANGANEDYRNAPAAAFGRLRGFIVIEGHRRMIDAAARIGLSFTSLSPSKFVTRRMAWISFSGRPLSALEARLLTFDDAPDYRSVNLLSGGEWRQAELESFALDTSATGVCPHLLAATLTDPAGCRRRVVEGQPRNYMTLSRPGFGGSRIHTYLGFATYQMDDQAGAGIFEYSRIAARGDPSDDGESDEA